MFIGANWMRSRASAVESSPHIPTDLDDYMNSRNLHFGQSDDEAGLPIIPPADRIDLSLCDCKAALVHTVTPYLRRIYAGFGRDFYNSEQYPWLPLDGHTSTAHDHKPDSFLAFYGHVEIKPTPDKYPYSVENMLFGIIPYKGSVFGDVNIVDFELVHDSGSVSKLKDQMKILHLGSGSEIVRGALCSVSGIYLLAIRADGKLESQLFIGWSQDGSVNALYNFFGEDCALVRVVRRLCRSLTLTIEPHTPSGGACPLLGCGYSGVVYRVTGYKDLRHAVALKVAFKSDFAQYLVMQHYLNQIALYFHERSPRLADLALVNVEAQYRHDAELNVSYAFAICTTIGVSKFDLTKDSICEILHLLCSVHSCGFTQGDPQLRNIVSTPDGLRFIDNSFIPIVSTRIKFREWKILLASILSQLGKATNSQIIGDLIFQIWSSTDHVATFDALATQIMELPDGNRMLPNYAKWIHDNREVPFLRCNCGAAE